MLDSTLAPTLAPTLAGHTLDPYFHVCAFFNSRDEEYRVLSDYYREGLDGGEKALHIVDPDLRRDHKRRLEASGIDVEGCEACGQLEVRSWQEAYLQTGLFDQDQMLVTVEKVLAASVSAGFPRIRIMGNMGWAVAGRPDSDELIEYEARVNDVLSRTRQPAICVYDTDTLSGTMLMDILRAHPLTLVGGVVHENPLFTPPAQLLAEIRARRVTTPA